jgi:hypothetical protein
VIPLIQAQKTLHIEPRNRGASSREMGLEAKQFGLQGLPLVRSKYEPELPPSLKGGNVKVVKGDGTTASDPSDALAITRAYPHTYAQPLVQLVAADAGQVKKHSSLRFFLTGCFLFSFSVSHCDMSSCCAFCMWYFVAVETILESSKTDSITW